MKKEEENRFEEVRPYPNEHAARIEDPEDFDYFRRKNNEFNYDFIDNRVKIQLKNKNRKR